MPRPSAVPVVLAALAALTLLALTAGPAHAGSYRVLTCLGDDVNRAWSPVRSGAGLGTATDCPARTPFDRSGLVQRTVGGGIAPFLSFAAHEFTAPAGTRLGSLSATGSFGRGDGHWTVGLMADGDGNAINGSTMVWGNTSGDSGGATFGYSGIAQTVNLGGQTHARWVVACGNLAGCPTDGIGGYPVRAWANAGGIAIEILDDGRPALAPSGELFAAGGWHRGSEVLSASATDATGIAATSLTIDDTPVDVRETACDYHRPVPCANRSDIFAFDTRRLADGWHVARFAAIDPAGNLSYQDQAIAVDNTAPGRPADVAVAGGEGWRRENGFTVSWSPPGGQVAPITQARYRLCDSGGDCEDGSADLGAGPALRGLRVPGPGDYRLSVWLEDAAGNADSATASDPVRLRFDDTVPGEASVQTPGRWLTAAAAAAARPRLRLGDGEPIGPSGIAGYSVTTDGSAPDATVDVPGADADMRPAALREGVTVVRARAVSGAGVPAAADGRGDLRVDATPPRADAAGLPGPDWQREPVTVEISGSDQVGLSGMAAAAAGAPLEDGAFVTVERPGAAPQRVGGDIAEVRLTEDGVHTLAYGATDAAGNASAQRTATVRIDGTAPEVLGFLAPDPADPRTLTALAADRHSGLAAAEIQVRRVGEDRWRPLDSRLRGARLSAAIDEDALPRGTYRFRIAARDAAGNARTSDRLLDGANAGEALVLDVPLRAGTALAVAAAGRPQTRRVCRSVRVRTGRSGRLRTVRRCTTVAVPAGPAVRVPFGRGLRVSGVLRTAAGAGVAAEEVRVLSAAAAPGASEAPRGVVRTGADGAFTYWAPAGSSRTLRFAYDGSRRLRPAAATLAIAVPARVTLGVSRRAVRNGQSVRFTGRLGAPPPAAGKLVELQAFYRRQWRTFATVRAGADGRFAHRYRFEATVGRVTYRFRAIVRREAAYPYEQAVSPLARVTVTG